MPRQIPIDLPVIEASGREEFFISPANAAAAHQIDDWPHWAEARQLLVGPEGAGKSHLAAIWAGDIGATTLPAQDLTAAPLPEAHAPLLIEDIHHLNTPAGEEALFHLLNRFAASRTPLLLTAIDSLSPPKLPDLATRLDATHRARIGAPDDTLLAALLLKHFNDRQLNPSDKLIAYLLPRMERSAAAAHALVVALDRHQLATSRRLSRKLAAELLDNPENPGR